MTGLPLRVAIIGAGPAAFYAADHLLKQAPSAEVDMFDRLPTPFGLVRHGVAPDHQKIKSVVKGFAAVAGDPRFRFFGNVEFGRDIDLAGLAAHYHQVLFATGAQTDRRMNIPGEDLAGSFPATGFVAWYNGHPSFRGERFNLETPAAVVVGVGNVAIDVARMLSLDAHELAATDMARHAVAALAASHVRDVYVLGRRGPAQAAFTTPELKELSELPNVDLVIDPAEAALDPLSAAELERANDPVLRRKVELIQALAGRPLAGRPRRLHLRFLVSPEELLDDGQGRVGAVRVVSNELVASGTGSLSAKPTTRRETIPAGLVFRSVGYRGVELPGVPFDSRWGVIANTAGRVCDPASDETIPGLYTAGWIKRGPSGVIGTNKADAVETVAAMLADAAAGISLHPSHPTAAEADAYIGSRCTRPVSFADWQRLDAMEVEAGARVGCPRVKFSSVTGMLAALDGEGGPPGN